MNVLPVGTAISPAYDAGDTLAPRVPDTVMFPPESFIVVSPLYVFAPDNVNVPEPDFCNAPVPDTTPPYDSASLRLNIRVLLFTTSPVMDPVVPPTPTDKNPSLMVVPPLYVFDAVSSNPPMPYFVSRYAPEMTPLKRPTE